ncbi:uncharacterized protein LOC121693577 [Alosa sapidissima]|uniref:uncharacterized protein LOC121693577 n=1 Tax=Alosa sapidissima TaxID=34773 RepID=UPI001C08BD78|nr:uncharacterized protein LOC121693577 [Alosa sapidissima]
MFNKQAIMFQNMEDCTTQMTNLDELLHPMTIFHVVEFFKEDPVTVAVVAKSWIVKTTKGHLCYWPRSGASKKAKKGIIPDKDRWEKHHVKLVPHSTTNDYDRALRWVKRAETQQNVPSGAEAQSQSRPHVVPARFREDNSDSSITDIEEEPQAGPSHHAATTTLLTPLPNCPLYEADKRSASHAPSGTPPTISSPDMGNDPREDIKKLLTMMTSFQTRVLAKLEHMDEVQQELKRLVCSAVPA